MTAHPSPGPAAPRERVLLEAISWLGALLGSGLGLFFLAVSRWEVRHGFRTSSPRLVLIPLAVALVGGVVGRLTHRRLAARVLAVPTRWGRVKVATAMETVVGVVLLVPLAWLLYLLKLWLDDLRFVGGVPAILMNCLLYFGFIGAVLGAATGLVLGLIAAAVPRPR